MRDILDEIRVTWRTWWDVFIDEYYNVIELIDNNPPPKDKFKAYVERRRLDDIIEEKVNARDLQSVSNYITWLYVKFKGEQNE